jgi:hypothetical protein
VNSGLVNVAIVGTRNPRHIDDAIAAADQRALA